MRILHVSTRLIIGGSQENTLLSCEGHAQNGHETHLAFGPIYGPEGTMLPRVEAFNRSRGAGEQAIRTHEVADLVREVSPRRDLRCLSQLKRLIRDVRPDVVHTHSSKAGILGRAAALSLLGRGAWRGAVVHTVHGPPFHRYESKLRNAMYIAAERFAAKRCHAIVCVADAMAEQFLSAGIGRPELYRTIRSGMETRAFLAPMPANVRAQRRTELGLDGSDTVIGTVARLSDLKGHADLVEALAPLMQRDPSIKLLWVGDGWLRGMLEAQLEAAGLAGRVSITGVVPPGEVPELIKLMDVLVHPSYREGLPRTVVQGLLSGVPVVATDVDGTGEAIVDGQTGRLCPPGDPAGLRDGVRWMLEDPERARATAEAGRESCAAAFDHAAMVAALEKLYDELLSEGERP